MEYAKVFEMLPVTKLTDLEKIYMQYVVTKHKGNLAQAAAYLGISRATMFRKVKEYEITRGK